MTVGSKIHTLRIQQGLTLEEVGQRVGVGKSTVRKWESGQIASMRIDKVTLLAQTFGVTPDYLLGAEELPPESSGCTHTAGMTVGERIKTLRLKYGYTQEELASMIGVQKAAVSKYEDGTVINLKRSVVTALSSVFHISPAYLLYGDDALSGSDPIEGRLLTVYHHLNADGQKMLVQIAESMAINPALSK